MRKTLTLALAVALFGVLAAVVVAQVGQDSAPSGTSATAGTTETTGTTETGATTEETTTTPTTTVEGNPERVRDDVAGGGDISGPCDEAEHANDPRCTGVVGGDHGGREHHGGDNSGPGSLNSGPGSVNSGGGGDDGFDDDSRGRGHSGGDDWDDSGSSGHGGDDSD